MNDFKEKIYNLIVDTSKEEINYENFTRINNWPEISFYDEDTDRTHYEILGTENCSIISITDEYIEIVSGDEWQEPHLMQIELYEDELMVTTNQPHEFLVGMDYDEIVSILEEDTN